MTAVLTVDRYEDLLRRSGLIPHSQLEQVLSTIHRKAGGRLTDSQILAQELVEAKLITDWQNDKLMQGRCKGFFLGGYKLLERIAKGGMSEVLLATDPKQGDRLVAIKIFPPHLIETTSYLARFKREGRVQMAFDHPHIVKAYDLGREGKIHYLVMEFVDGEDLTFTVRREGPLNPALSAEYIRQGALGLDYAHRRGLVHRDVKPGNLMIDSQGLIKLLDLGLARVGSEEGSLTRKFKENALGTADYISPEQAVDSHRVDMRSDIYSLGGTLHFLLTGHPPFPEGSPVQRMMAHISQEPRRIEEFRSDVPTELAEICRKMMAKQPEKRFQTAAAVHNALASWLDPSIEHLPEPRLRRSGSANGQPPAASSAKTTASHPSKDPKASGPDSAADQPSRSSPAAHSPATKSPVSPKADPQRPTSPSAPTARDPSDRAVTSSPAGQTPSRQTPNRAEEVPGGRASRESSPKRGGTQGLADHRTPSGYQASASSETTQQPAESNSSDVPVWDLPEDDLSEAGLDEPGFQETDADETDFESPLDDDGAFDPSSPDDDASLSGDLSLSEDRSRNQPWSSPRNLPGARPAALAELPRSADGSSPEAAPVPNRLPSVAPHGRAQPAAPVLNAGRVVGEIVYAFTVGVLAIGVAMGTGQLVDPMALFSGAGVGVILGVTRVLFLATQKM